MRSTITFKDLLHSTIAPQIKPTWYPYLIFVICHPPLNKSGWASLSVPSPPQGSFCPESLAASHHRWRSVLASTPITLTIQVFWGITFQFLILKIGKINLSSNLPQECPASLSLASPHERDGVADGARPRPLLLPPRPRHQCCRLQQLSSRDCTHCLVGFYLKKICHKNKAWCWSGIVQWRNPASEEVS